MPFNTTTVKSILWSKTFYAALVMIIAAFSPKVYALVFGGATQADAVTSIVQYIGLIGGFFGVIYGRIKANTTVTLTGAPPAK